MKKISVTFIGFCLIFSLLITPIPVHAFIASDQSIYSPGDVVTIFGDNRDGSHFQSGENVVVTVYGPNGFSTTCNDIVDSNGAWSCQITLPTDPSMKGIYYYGAAGQSSDEQQNSYFINGHILVTGTVTDANYNPIPGASLVCVEGCSVSVSATSDAEGNFTFSAATSNEIKIGGYESISIILQISKEGYYGSRHTRTIAQGMTYDWSVYLRPVDTTAPVITPEVTGVLGNTGWYVGDVSLSWDISEPDTTYWVDSGCENTLIDTDTSGTTFDCAVHSLGGSAESSLTIKRDATDPGINWTGAIQNGDTFYYGSVPSAPTCSAVDSMSGPDGCAVTGYSSSIGSHTLTATAKDLAGNQTIEQRSYTVTGLTLSGFSRPIKMNNFNRVKRDQVVALRFEIFEGDLELVNPSAVASVSLTTIDCQTQALLYAPVLLPMNNLGYNVKRGQFIYRWVTPSTDGCYRLSLTAQGGQEISALFIMK